MASTATYTCASPQCRKPFQARTADRARGWARFCSKACKAIAQEENTGQYRAYLARHEDRDPDMEARDAGWDGHKGSF